MTNEVDKSEGPEGTVTEGGMEGTITWRELWSQTTEALAVALPDAEPAEARWLIEEASGADDGDFYRVLDQLATVRGVAHLDAMVGRRRQGEPIQYVLGHWAFRRLDLMVDRRVLIPRPETEVLVEVALGELDRIARSSSVDRLAGASAHEPLRVVDLGTGSGAIGLSIASERPGTSVTLTDRSTDALAVARANLAGIGSAAIGVSVVEGSWFEPLDPAWAGSIALIASNPPYVAPGDDLDASVLGWEPAAALFADQDGTADLAVLADSAPRWLSPGGALVVEMDPRQVEWFGDQCHWADSIDTVRDLAGLNRIVVARLGS